MEDALLPSAPPHEQHSNVPYSEAHRGGEEKGHINIPMEDTRERQKECTSYGGNNVSNAATTIPAENDDAFTLSFEYDATFRAHKAAPVAKIFDEILRKVYHYSLFGTYNLIVFIVGMFLVVFWGVTNALTIFSQTWCLSPAVRYTLVSMQCMVYPVYEISKSLFKCTNELCVTLGAGCCICCRKKAA